MSIVLIGNQNCGKTTLFNALTGSHQHVGNFPGVTVDAKLGYIKQKKNLLLVDLPGIYSLSPYSMEEVFTRNFLFEEDVQAIINIVDACHLERNLYLSLQLMDLGIPIIIALNMMDELKTRKGDIHTNILEDKLGVPVVKISAKNEQGLILLLEKLEKVMQENICPKPQNVYTGAIFMVKEELSILLRKKVKFPRFVAEKILENDSITEKKEFLTNDIIQLSESLNFDMSEDHYEMIATMRYQWIEEIVRKSTEIPSQNNNSQIIDQVLIHRYLGIPIFALIIFLIFFLSFGWIGGTISHYLSNFIVGFGQIVSNVLLLNHVEPLFISLVIDGIVSGVGSVLSFLPVVMTLFFFLSVLEDSGYLARITFLFDCPMHQLGLTGKSFVPLLIGFGCSVPAIMASRTLVDKRDRKITILLIPFMSCSAKLPVYSLFCMIFFQEKAVYVMIVLYCLGIILACIAALIFKSVYPKKEETPFLIEFPEYRMPSFQNSFMHAYRKAKDFIQKAMTVIFLASLLIWFFKTFDLNFQVTNDIQKSILAKIGRSIAFIFYPMGLNDWRIATSLLMGLSAKETILSTLAVVLNSSMSRLQTSLFTPLSTFSFLVFTLLYSPCLAALRTVAKEMNNRWLAISLMIAQTLIAWIIATIVYQMGYFFLYN